MHVHAAHESQRYSWLEQLVDRCWHGHAACVVHAGLAALTCHVQFLQESPAVNDVDL